MELMYIANPSKGKIMQDQKMLDYIKAVVKNMPADWLNLTTHRLDIFNEKLAKTEFVEQFENLYKTNNSATSALHALPTAFDYIRLGHPLSCVFEWTLANLYQLSPKNVISFSSKTIGILAILRKNLLADKPTQIVYTGDFPQSIDVELLKQVYGYKFELKKVEKAADISAFNGSTIFITQQGELSTLPLSSNIDFLIYQHADFGSIIFVNSDQNEGYISEIQHVRRRETVAMTPANCLTALRMLTEPLLVVKAKNGVATNKKLVLDSIKTITGTDTTALLGSSGLSIQYAITMGLIHDALEKHPGKAIKIIIPPNCYGGTNDQARRVAACLKNVEVVDLPVDSGRDMVQSIDTILDKFAGEAIVPYIIAEIPTNPRVEVPDLIKLEAVLSKNRKATNGQWAIDPVFILDQTFCPNVHFLGEGEILSTVRTIAYVSGSKFPSGGQVTAGYCVANKKAADLMEKVNLHLQLCDNEATDFQIGILAKQMPSMLERIQEAYKNTREFVNHIQETLPTAKINFVSQALAAQGFTPSVFSVKLPTRGATPEEREAYERELNHRLINLMISEIPNESKHCVSYGQLKGCYWTIPATSTQGTTKEGDKDYIVRVSLSPNMDIEQHKKVFSDFVGQLEV